MKKQLVTSSVFRFIERVIVVVTSLLLTPFLIDVLGQQDYGLWILIISVLGWFNVIDLGFSTAVQRYIVLALESSDHRKVNIIFSTAFALFSALGIFAASCLLILAQFPDIFGVDEAREPTLLIALSILSLKVFWDFLMNSFHGIFSGLLRFDIDANLSSLNAISKALLVFYLVTEFNIYGAIFATLAADFLTNVLKVIFAKRLYKNLKFSVHNVSIKELKLLFSFSKHVLASGVAQTLNSKVDPILVTRLFDLSTVAIYSIASRLTGHIQAFVSSVTGVFAPVFTKMVARDENMAQIFTRTTSINTFAATVLFLPLLIFGGVFIKLWVGDEFENSIYILNILVFSFLCQAVSTAVRNVLFAQANHKLISIVNLLGAIFNIGLSITLSQYWGVLGVASGTAIGFFISDVVLSLVLLNHYNDFKLMPIIKCFSISIVIVFGLGLMGQYFVDLYMQRTWWSLVVYSVSSFPVMVLICWFSLLNKDLRDKLVNLLKVKIQSKRPVVRS